MTDRLGRIFGCIGGFATAVAPRPAVAAPGAPAASPAETEIEPPSAPKPERGRRSGRRNDSPPPVGELSSAGTDQGRFEIILGSVTLGVAGALGVVGALSLATGLQKRSDCPYDFEAPRCQLIPPGLDFAAAGLSFALMIPLTAAAALLLRKGVRIRRDYKAFQNTRSGFSVGNTGPGLAASWTLRF